MGPDHNTIFTDGKKVLHRSGAGKLIVFLFLFLFVFYLETNKDGYFARSAFISFCIFSYFKELIQYLG